ncbi:MAG: hypothetical protein HND44_19515 [Chloroflexi bacterium]|nr:hypothetical protein [Ardenticatenaceae bacterium]NOG36734.1 hypothetical protein [Chloroflexota bacterium]
MNQESISDYQIEKMLIAFFRRNGCVQLVDEERRKKLGQKYRKRYEVRLIANSEEELETIRYLLKQSGFKPGKPYQKRRQFVQAVYGKSAVDWFTREG